MLIKVMATAKADVEQSLLKVVDTWLFPLTQGCEVNLRHIVSIAAARIDAEGCGHDQAKLLEAECNLVHLLQEMTSEAISNGCNELHETTFFNALNKLCPIWPFC